MRGFDAPSNDAAKSAPDQEPSLLRACLRISAVGAVPLLLLGGCPEDELPAAAFDPSTEPDNSAPVDPGSTLSDAEIIGDFVAVPPATQGTLNPSASFDFATVCPVRAPLTVRDPRGNALSDASVTVRAQSGVRTDVLFRGRTDEDGRVTLDLAVLQSYKSVEIIVAKPFYERTTQQVPAASLCDVQLELTLPLETHDGVNNG